MAAENERLAGDAGPGGAAPVFGPVQGPKRDKLTAEAEASCTTSRGMARLTRMVPTVPSG